MTIEEMNAKYGRPTTTSSNSGSIADLWGQPQEPQDSFLKTIIKEPIKQLLVKPAARTAEAVGRTGILGENIQKGYESMADTGQKIGGFNIEPVQNDRQVVGEALQTASYLFPYGKVAGAAGKAVGSKLAGNVISGAAGGYTADVGYGLADNTQTTGEALTPGLGTAIGGAIPLVAPATRVAGRALAKTGEKVVDAVIPASSREAQILQTYKANNPFFKRVSDVLKGTDISPTTAGKTTATKSLFGTKSQIGIQAKRAEEKLWNEVISPRLKESTYAVDLDGFFSKIEDDIITNNPEVSRQKSLLNALNSFKDDYAGTKAISLEKLQKLKEGWAEFVPEKFYKGENIAGNAKQVQALLADEARQTIYSQLGDDVKQAYLDYGNLQGLKKMGVVSMTGQKLKGGTGGFVSELFSQAVTPIGTVGGQAIYRVGKGIEFIGNLGAKNLGEALGIQGGMKFPGDMAVDDISATIKKAKSLPNQQGGFIKIGQDANLPTKTQSSQTASKMNSNVISPKSTTKSLKVKGETPSTNLISEAKKYKSAEVKKLGLNPDNIEYHGTGKSFDKFTLGEEGSSGAGTENLGVFTTKSKEAANFWAEKSAGVGKNGKVMEVYLDVKNPKIFKSQQALDDFIGDNPEQAIDKLKKQGFDAIKYPESGIDKFPFDYWDELASKGVSFKNKLPDEPYMTTQVFNPKDVYIINNGDLKSVAKKIKTNNMNFFDKYPDITGYKPEEISLLTTDKYIRRVLEHYSYHNKTTPAETVKIIREQLRQ